jgi:alcohol dehydrogenase, propanol-preferring
MKAMLLTSVTDLDHNPEPLIMSDIPVPAPAADEILLKVLVCGVCHTELDEIEGRTAPSRFPLVPGHQVVGIVEKAGSKVSKLKQGDRVGVAWIFSACGSCSFCLSGHENLCPDFIATGRDVNGGYAEYMIVRESFAYPIPAFFSDSQAAPLLCAGAVGYRSLRLSGLKDGKSIGLTGFGASGHLVLQMIKHRFPRSGIFVFARSEEERSFAMDLGASWCGDTSDTLPDKLDCIIDTTPVWKPVIESLRNLKPGGRLVINAIRKQETDKELLLKLDFSVHLWMEKEIKSVANVTRTDVIEFLKMAAEIPILPEIQEYKLNEANVALHDLKERKIRGAKVLTVARI